jgi:hypothetical protein
MWNLQLSQNLKFFLTTSSWPFQVFSHLEAFEAHVALVLRDQSELLSWKPLRSVSILNLQENRPHRLYSKHMLIWSNLGGEVIRIIEAKVALKDQKNLEH